MHRASRSRRPGVFALPRTIRAAANSAKHDSADGVGKFRFSAADRRHGYLSRWPAVRFASELRGNEFSYRWPSFLPDGRHFIYFAQTWAGQPSDHDNTHLASLDSGEEPPLLSSSGPAIYAPSGYVVFVRERMLLALRFDAKKL